MPKIRIYTKAGHQIDLDVYDFSIVKGKQWTARFKDRRPKLISLDPADIEAVVQLTFDGFESKALV